MTRSVIALFVVALALPPTAQAQGPGVFVDPESPAGTEYAIPLEEARRHGAPDAEPRPRGGDAAPPLFGEGITPAPGGPAAGAGSGDGGEPGAGGGRGGDPGARKAADGEVLGAQEAAPDRRRSSMAIEAAAQGGSDALLTAGIAGAVLALGLLVGIGLRRGLRTE